ncbi:MAG: type III-B CRISPR module RAMP protein Cmr6 [Spirochaetales bacterium]
MKQNNPDSEKKGNEKKGFLFYPSHKQALEITQAFPETGNFGLWYNKYVPVVGNSTFKPCDMHLKAEEAIPFYCDKANNIFDKIEKTSPLRKALIQKHAYQTLLLAKAKEANFETIEIWAETKNRFLTGIGNSHPSETSLTLDYILGIPFIPASTIKGIVRFCNALRLIETQKIQAEKFNDVLIDINTKRLFGSSADDFKNKKTKPNKGSLIFLDAYPIPPVTLEIDILNPHYMKYYEPNNRNTWPADCSEPIPVKYLVVKPGTKFIFRCIVPVDLKSKVEVLYKDIFNEGIGAKTSSGYGKFDCITEDSHFVEEIKKEIQNLSTTRQQIIEGPESKILSKIAQLKKDRSEIGQIAKEVLEGNYSLLVYRSLKNKLIELNEWEPEKGPAFQKMAERKKKLEEKITVLSNRKSNEE